MMREMIAVGQWYLREDTRERFQVLDFDERAGTVRIQMFDGSLDEFDEEAWRALSAERVEPPEDWTGPLDNVDIDELEEFESAASAGSDEELAEDGELWESLLVDEGEDAQEPEEEDERWMSHVLVARDYSRQKIPSRSRA